MTQVTCPIYSMMMPALPIPSQRAQLLSPPPGDLPHYQPIPTNAQPTYAHLSCESRRRVPIYMVDPVAQSKTWELNTVMASVKDH
ncbi:unnamed protein product [Chondrus crispus]|uniref:Uncharacterized protein n=1 Tax=Chondrus crispus TaxID=2769 RepID=R7QCK8_CHOCR|nr:unnamed protein product [Chondrus crispus]CDF35478.1 unnamed protein product [Chondrus crispus]|eukprot:XP_005715297.1 unnamed protein product [Chondrus crispus]